MQEVKKVTEPLQPLVDVLTSPIPVISDLAGSPVTLIDIAGMTGYVKPGLIYAIADVIKLVNSIPDPSVVGALIIPFGDFVIFSRTAGAGHMPDLSNPNFDRSSVALPDTSSFNFQSALNGLNTHGDAHSETTKSFSNGFAGHSFGIGVVRACRGNLSTSTFQLAASRHRRKSPAGGTRRRMQS